MAQSCCVTPYPFGRRSSLVPPRKLTLDQHPKIHNSTHERGHTNTYSTLTHETHHKALTMLVEGLIGMLLYRFTP